MKSKNINRSRQGGQVLIISILFFLAVSIIFMTAIATPIANQVRGAADYIQSMQGYVLADSSISDVFYRLNTGKTVGSSVEFGLNGGGASTTVTNLTSTSKRILSVSNVNGHIRKSQIEVSQGAGVAFNYGLQAGNGGVTMGGGSTVVGNIYSNGDIDAISATITGSATAADSSALVADQSNDTPATPTSSITFRNTSAAQDFAQSFQVSTSSPINSFMFYIKKVGSPSDATIRIVADNAGSPSTTVIPIGTVSLLSSQVTTNYGWVTVTLASPPALIPDTTYWVVIDNSTQNASSYYILGANSSYALGVGRTGAYSGTWTAGTLDAYFRVYTGGISSLIGGATYASGLLVGTGSVGNAWATTVKGTTVAGSLYCTTGTNNNKACNTTQGSPSPQGLPFSDANIQDWKDEAEAGGTIVGNYSVGWAGATLGPKKITGNLTVNGGGTLTIAGTLWVQGTITINGGGKMRLPANYALNSGTIISDSTVNISGGGSLGSGTPGSFLFVVSTSQCPYAVGCSGANAISVTGGAGAIAVNAQEGNVSISGGGSLKAAVGNSISISGGATVTYDSGLASPSFSSGPSGAYQITSWTEPTN
jgi:hypothetical protein